MTPSAPPPPTESPAAARAALLYGTVESPPPARRLRAGPLSALLIAGNLRTIRYGDVELIRGISFLVRTQTWGTLAPAIDNLRIREETDAFYVSYAARAQDGAQVLEYTAAISGHPDGRLIFVCDAIAVTTFVTCRTGFVVLHPIAGVAGRPARIEHTDGTEVVGAFPDLIDPVQPMQNLRAITHEAAPGLLVTCRMEGDVFEMEDQRNWTDASFKTYVRPLALPWPYSIDAGTRLSQRITVSVAGPVPHGVAAGADVQLALGETIGEMPPLGLGCTPEEAAAALPYLHALRAAGLHTLVCRFDPRMGHGPADLVRYRQLAEGMGAAVELQLVVPSVDAYAADIAAAAEAVAAAGLTPAAVMVVPAADLVSTPPGSPWPPAPPLEALYRAARAAFPRVRLGGGMFTHFTELNRKRPPLDTLDFITFATTAIVHAADDQSVMETIETLPALAASARAIAGRLPFVVGPSAIGMRDNPNGPGPLPNPAAIRLPMAGRDPRQRGLFNAAWSLGYIAAFARGGAARVALSAPAGDFGILDESGVWPVYHVLRACAALRGGQVRAVTTQGAAPAAALAVSTQGAAYLLVANLGEEPLALNVPDEFTAAPHRLLDVAALRAGAGTPDAFEPTAPAPQRLLLDSYAVAMLRRTG